MSKISIQLTAQGSRTNIIGIKDRPRIALAFFLAAFLLLSPSHFDPDLATSAWVIIHKNANVTPVLGRTRRGNPVTAFEPRKITRCLDVSASRAGRENESSTNPSAVSQLRPVD